MPKPVRAQGDVDGVRGNILESASKIILEHGFAYLSMRKLASALGMTAANIYNYYTNKDELYLAIQTKGFVMLHDALAEGSKGMDEPRECLKGFVHAYLAFGMQYANYYEIMFSRNTPKYADYVGTDTQPVALHEKQTALKCMDIVTDTITGMSDAQGKITPADARLYAIQAWTALHGVISLYNTRVLQEVDS
ncbi:MAG: TetR/AcrR family transcriptional regulator, partial [Thermodesulfobacteriota bacterium]|nr:TetR/AcrR family transcriptional regulator [Thermodesulfobacteriota bacterium]